MRQGVNTWHYGLVALWWAGFKVGGDDVGFSRDAIERCGAPALDAGCGTGRLLLAFLRSGMDVDGSDMSGDMLGGEAGRCVPDPEHPGPGTAAGRSTTTRIDGGDRWVGGLDDRGGSQG